MTSKISYNIHAQGVRDQNKLLDHLRKIQPKSVLVMNGYSLCKTIKSQNPDTIVIHREWPDDDIYLRMTPAQWIASKKAVIGSDDIWVYTTNEPGYDPKIIQWHEELLKLNFASPNPLKLVIMNASSGVPKPEDWNLSNTLLKLMAQNHDKVILGLHEYFGAVATSGFIGGTPEDTKYHPNYVDRKNWPNQEAAKGITKWHCGRFQFLVDYCKNNNIQVPRIIMTEHGADAMGDIDAWLKSLRPTPPSTGVRGYKTLTNQWKLWYPDWSNQQTYFELVKYLDQNIYRDTVVEAQLIFCYGHVTAEWAPCDLEGEIEFMSLLEKYASSSINTPPAPVVIPPPPVVVPPPLPPVVVVPPGTVPAESVVLPGIPSDFNNRSIKVIMSSVSGAKLNIRSKPTASSDIVAYLSAPTEVTYISSDSMSGSEKVFEIISGANGIWVPVLINNVYGWIFNALISVTPSVSIIKPVNIEDQLKAIESSVVDIQNKLNSITATIQTIRSSIK